MSVVRLAVTSNWSEGGHEASNRNFSSGRREMGLEARVVSRHRIFGDYLRTMRERKGITLAALAKILGCSVPYLSDVETGRRNPLTEKNIDKTADFLGVPRETMKNKAALSLGQFKIPPGSEKSDHVAMRLVKVWTRLADEDLQAIEEIANRAS